MLQHLKRFAARMTDGSRGWAGVERTLTTAAVAVLVLLAVRAFGANWHLSLNVFTGTFLGLLAVRAVVFILRKRGVIDLDNHAASSGGSGGH